MPDRQQTLDALRRYHRLLIFGGRYAAALVILLALLADGMALVRSYAADQRQMFAASHRLVRERIDASEHAFLIGLARAELSWEDDSPVPQDVVERFRANGNLMYWKPFASDRLEILITGEPGARLNDRTIVQFFLFARQIARTNLATAKALERQSTQVFFSPDRKIAAILPSSAVAHPERLNNAAGRADFIKELGAGAESLANRVGPKTSGDRPDVRWSPQLHRLPDGKSVLRLAAPVIPDGREVATLVTEIDADDLIWPLAGGGYSGAFALVNDGGEILSSTTRDGTSDTLRPFIKRWRQARPVDAGKQVEQYFDGRMVLAQRLSGTGYTLLYIYAGRDIAAAIWPRALAAATLLAAVLAAIWLLFYLLNRRIFLPMYARSEQVFESERLSRTLIETVPVGIGLISTSNGQLLYGGLSLATLADLVDGGMPRLLAELMARHRRNISASSHADTKTEDVYQADITLPTRAGDEIALQTRFALGRYLGEDVLVTAFVDVTASQQLAQQLRDATRAADQANAAKSAFLAAMSHEIRTPLNAVLGNLELLSHSSLDALQRDRLRTIRASSNGLLTIIQDVLDFSKIEAGEMQLEQIPFNVADVMTRALAMFAPVAQAKGIALYGAFGMSTDQPMRGDPVRLAQIVHNLLSNGIKFTAAGKVTMYVSCEAADGKSGCGPALVVSVDDTGIGMNEVQRAQLFKAFAQADSSISRRFGGTGLGLALCQRLAAQMGGTIDVHSVDGEGSRFTVRVPLDCAEPAAGPICTDAHPFTGQRVTFVAAAAEWHAYAVTLMQAWGATVNAAHHPDQVADVDTDADGGVLVICGDRTAWPADSENRIVEAARVVVNCDTNGPLQPTRVGRMLVVSCYSPAGLRVALEHALNDAPLVPNDAAQGANVDSDSGTPPVRQLGLRVLVAEDNMVNQQLFKEQLALLGCTARIADDGVQALQMLSEETIDVVLTDLNMPRLDGYVLAQIVRGRWPDMPIVAVTANTTVEEHRRCMALGIHAVVSKPLSLNGLAKVLAQVAEPCMTRSPDAGDGKTTHADFEISQAVIDIFLASCKTSIDVLTDSLARRDTTAMLAELHALKGALGVVQLRKLVQQCSTLEQQIYANDLTSVNTGLDILIEALKTLLTQPWKQEAQKQEEAE